MARTLKKKNMNISYSMTLIWRKRTTFPLFSPTISVRGNKRGVKPAFPMLIKNVFDFIFFFIVNCLVIFFVFLCVVVQNA